MTASLPREFVQRARDHVAGEVQEMLTVPMPATAIYVRRIGKDSYDPKASLLSTAIPPVPGEPELAPEVNPFEDDEAEASSLHSTAVDEWERTVDAAQDALDEAAAAIREMDLTPDTRTEPAGCFAKAAELFEDKRGVLTVFSDLKERGPQPEEVEFSLGGAPLRVVYWCDETAAECLARRSRWASVFEGWDGAVEWIDASDEASW